MAKPKKPAQHPTTRLFQSARQQLNIVVDLIPVGHSNRPGTPSKPTKVTIHNTDNDSPGADCTAQLNIKKEPTLSNGRSLGTSRWMTAPFIKACRSTNVGWHAGTHAGNHQSIGIEICENQGIDKQAANDRAALLTAVQLHELGIPLSNNVVPASRLEHKRLPGLARHPASKWTAFLQKVADFYHQLIQMDTNTITR